jgi:1,4-alpha-glucan branching enzyme
VSADKVRLRLAALSNRDLFDPESWPAYDLQAPAVGESDWTIDLSGLSLADGDYEYEFVITRNASATVVADPMASEITRFGGYRGLLRLEGGHRIGLPTFRWDEELPAGVHLAENAELVIYELPTRWMTGDAGSRHVSLGTFDDIIFERLNELTELGVNAIELLPPADSPDTLNWGYGTRFFQAPDVDLGDPTALRLLVKRCHQRGIRVLVDIVMNHASRCPLEILARDAYFLRDGGSSGGTEAEPVGRPCLPLRHPPRRRHLLPRT